MVKEEFQVSTVISKIDQAGRISISSQQRRALGLEPGSPVVLNIVGNELRVRSMHAAMAELQAESEPFLQSEGASVDLFLAQRRADADEKKDEATNSEMSDQSPTPVSGR